MQQVDRPTSTFPLIANPTVAQDGSSRKPFFSPGAAISLAVPPSGVGRRLRPKYSAAWADRAVAPRYPRGVPPGTIHTRTPRSRRSFLRIRAQTDPSIPFSPARALTLPLRRPNHRPEDAGFPPGTPAADPAADPTAEFPRHPWTVARIGQRWVGPD